MNESDRINLNDIDEEKELDEFIKDVRRLARYAVETAQFPSSIDVKELYHVYHKYWDQKDLESEDFRFLVDSYQKLERRLGPISAETLKATEQEEFWPKDKSKESAAGRYVRNLRKRTVINVLLILLTHLIHTASGVEMLSNSSGAQTVILWSSISDEPEFNQGPQNDAAVGGAETNTSQEIPQFTANTIDTISTNIDEAQTESNTSIRKTTVRAALLEHGIWQGIVTLLGLIALYIIPFLYGALGADAYILRVTTHDLRNRQFDPRRIPQYDSRLIVGALAGGVIIFFVSEELITAVTSPFDLTYAPIGFIAGYSTDFLFNSVERIINAILPRIEPQPVSRSTEDILAEYGLTGKEQKTNKKVEGSNLTDKADNDKPSSSENE